MTVWSRPSTDSHLVITRGYFRRRVVPARYSDAARTARARSSLSIMITKLARLGASFADDTTS